MDSRDDRDEQGRPLDQEDDCVELPLLLSNEQWAALEQAAHCQGLTMAVLLRRLIRAYLMERRGWAPIRTGTIEDRPGMAGVNAE